MTGEPPVPGPDRPLPPLFAGRTGRGVRVAVIDSGVHPDHPHVEADRIAPGVAVLADGTIVEEAGAALDRLGHGTAVTAAILEKAPEATILPVRVFRDGLRASAAALVAGVLWSLEHGVDVVNLSLGTSNPAHAAAFGQVVARARERGVAMVAAREANGEPCLPGVIEGVLGVGLDWECPRERLRGDAAGVLFASGYPRAIPGVPHRRNLYGISFAVAQASGFAALALEGLGAGAGRLAGPARIDALAAALRAAANHEDAPA